MKDDVIATWTVGPISAVDADRVEYAPHRFCGRAYAEANGLVPYRRPTPAPANDAAPAPPAPSAAPKRRATRAKRPLADILAEAERGHKAKVRGQR